MPLFKRNHQAPHPQDLVDPHAWDLPSYSASSSDKPTLIPSRRVFANVHSPAGIHGAYPNVSHVAAHLALLECFRNLRRDATSLDIDTSCPSQDQHDSAAIHQRKWTTFTNLAVTRFSAWWSNIDKVLIHASAYGHHAGHDATVQLSKDYLPPLDVLLAWYAFMLDPPSYRASCLARQDQVPQLRALRFPWPAILDAMDLQTMQYTLPASAERKFQTLTGQSSDILTYLKQPPAYTEETQPVWVNLAAQMKTHDAFIEHAHALLWIRSPALHGSLTRSISEYFKSAREPELLSGEMPFGIKLVGRTHRLFPEHYSAFLPETVDLPPSYACEVAIAHVVGKQKVRVDHAADKQRVRADDTVKEQGSAKHDAPHKHNSGIHRYRKCHCWTCERIRDDLPHYTHTSTAESFDTSQLTGLSAAQVRQIKDDVGFHTAVENARRRGNPLPTRAATAAEKEMEELARVRQDKAGVLPGLYEYVDLRWDGTPRVRRQRNAMPWSGLARGLGI